MDPHQGILAQLAELKRWHEEHCEGDDSRGSTPGDPDDRAKIYQMLGLSPSFINEIEISQSSAVSPVQHVAWNNSVSPRDESKGSSENRVHLKITNNLSGDASTSTVSNTKPARPFLRRGEGLTSRFKIHPDRYKLQNLPKYKFNTSNKRRSKEVIQQPLVEKDPSPDQPEETPFKYNAERTRKSCLKSESLVQLEELRVKMTKLCTNAIEDDSDESDGAVPPDPPDNEDKAKRMLDFSRKSPRVTFHSEVTKIPFENYFYPTPEPQEESGDGTADSGEEDHAEEMVTTESIHCEFQVDAAFQKNAFISTPVDVFKEQHLLPLLSSAEKSPRTVLVEKGSQLRQKLKELEEETQNFREQNRQMQRLRQNIELEKVQLAKQRNEMQRSFKEQQLKAELDYEQLKAALEADRLKMEQRSLVPSKKLKEETRNLRDKIDELEKEIKNREVKHGASQTRLRSHIRTLEKENREHVVAVEALKKENKRLEAENARLLRQKNNKMLTEINKNIAKLATSTPTEVAKVAEVPTKPRPNKGAAGPVRRAAASAPILTQQQKVSAADSPSVSSSSDDESQSVDLPTGPSTYFPATIAYKSRVSADAEKENKEVLPPHLLDTTVGPKKEIVHEDGSKDVYYPNGNLKKISADGMVLKVLYFNKDIKETNINEGTVKYYYAETKTWHTSYLDGLEILEFPSGQTEHRFKDGKIEIYFPNGTVRVTTPKDNDVAEEWRYPDGTVVLEMKSKEKVIKMPNGQREIHTEDHKRREYPDGTVKIVYGDGRTETRYCNGRIRIKGSDGQLISDSLNVT